ADDSPIIDKTTQQACNVLLELRDPDGHLLINGPTTTFTYNSDALPDANGVITYHITITAQSKGNYTLLALLDVHAQTARTTPFAPPCLGSPGPGGGAPWFLQYGPGPLTPNFALIPSSPVSRALPGGGRSSPPVVGFDPASSKAPALQQPNVAAGFNQVP